ncbi:hypothetical protein KSP39_PZI023054 [Platanthera zijinensis]|uniref:Prolamin-like domain-containing protein n=1 Tax=Platanthera zijinensis TaxID=2320716 RepID=A0AAP0AW25_9ASPA
MAKSAAATAYAILFLVVAAGTAVPTASSFQILPDIVKCLLAFGQFEKCGVKLVPSHLALQVTLTDGCCKAIIGIEESCLHIANTTSLFGPAFTNLTSTVTSLVGPVISNLTSTICGPVSSIPHPRKFSS